MIRHVTENEPPVEPSAESSGESGAEPESGAVARIARVAFKLQLFGTIGLLILLPVLLRSPVEHYRTDCSNSLRQLGLALMCIGIAVLVLATIEYARRISKMRQLGLPRVSRYPLPLTAAGAMAFVVVGIVALIGILINWPV